MSMLRRLNIALVAAAALAAATWSVPAAANGERPSGAAVSEKVVDATPKKTKRAGVRKRVAAAPRVRAPLPPVSYRWFAPPYERVAVYWPVLLGVGF